MPCMEIKCYGYKGNCLKRNNKRLFVSKAKNLNWICLDEKLKSFTMTKCFHLYRYGFCQQTITEHNCPFNGR